MPQTSTCHRLRCVLLLLFVLLLSLARTSAQTSCNATQTTPIIIETATGVGILQAAVNCTGGGLVEAAWAGSVPVDAPISILEGTFLSVTREGALAEVYGGGAQTRLFEVAEGGGLTLTQLNLSGGSAEEGGGAIYSESATLTLSNCTFEGNTATNGSGGAVWANGGTVTIVGGEFLANTATGYGGAVHAVEGTLVVEGGSRFEENTATVGGAVFCGMEMGSEKPVVLCSITDAEFVSNSAAREDQEYVSEFSLIDGGGAAMFLYASVKITDSVFSRNHALLSGGALHGGFDTDMLVSGCKFGNNTSEKYGGAITASSMTLGGGTQLADNEADDDGGAVVGWDENGTVVFNDVLCTENSAVNHGGCFYAVGKGIVNDGAVMLDNSATNGGSILAAEGCNISVTGGNFTSRSSVRGGFLYAEDRSEVKITGGSIENNIASKRGGAVYINGNDASNILIEGGTFRNNKALEMGGAIAMWGESTLAKVTGGTFENNKAMYYGGFIFIEEGGSFTCEGATITGNYAGDQGGGIYARQATLVTSSCHVVANESPQGAAIYLTNVENATFENHNVTDNLASGGSVVYVAASSVVAKRVTFASSVGLQDYSFNRAVQLDDNSTLTAEKCVFDGWLGDTVVFNDNSANGSLVLNSCDFSGSSALFAVVSPNSNAEIRNAVVSSFTVENAVVNNSLALVDRALDCSDSRACGAGACVDSLLGVICECLEGGECLHDGGALSVRLETRPDTVTFSPDTVSYELSVSAAAAGTTFAIWVLEFEGGELDLDIVPSSGVLAPGGAVVVTVTGTPSTEDVGGLVTNIFNVTSHSISTTADDLNVRMTFYFCHAYEYAMPPESDDEEVSCEQCANIGGEEGVNCTRPGATLASLPILQGFWRANTESLVVHECLYSEACVGATVVSSSDDYCEDGYKGPYCAVCSEGFGRGVGHTCYYCDNTKAHLLLSMAALFAVVVFLLGLLAVVFLIGGLDAIDIVRHSVGQTFSAGKRASSIRPAVLETTLQERSCSEMSFRMDSLDATAVRPFEYEWERNRPEVRTKVDPLDATVVPAFSLASEAKHCGGEGVVTGLSKQFSTNCYDVDGTRSGPLGAVVGAGAELSEVTSRNTPRDAGVSARRDTRLSHVAGNSVGGPQASRKVEMDSTNGGKPKCCGLGDKIKRLVSLLPLNKLKILVVVWQILTVCSSITGIEFPASYARFLAWVNIANFDIGDLFSASCLLPSINFYQRLLVTTLAPLVLTAVLALTYRMAMRRAGVGSVGVTAKRAAWSRHLAAGLLVTFLVFTSASTAAFQTFACDDEIEERKSYLRADYSLSCKSNLHVFFQVYAALMILVYPIGIPVLYAAILWRNRELLNPRIHTQPVGVDETAPTTDSASRTDNTSDRVHRASKGLTKTTYSRQELKELEEKVKARRENPELVPSIFLWKDFGPDLYYYEVVECGRRMLLTGVLIFIAPHTATQVAMACMFAFASLLGFELMRPHMDPSDAWLYRLGCVVIFLSNFLALLIKVDAGEEEDREMFGALLVAVNVLLVFAVMLTSWFAVQQSVDDYREDENSFTLAKTMLTAEQHAVKSSRLTRSRRALASLASSAVRPDASWAGSTIGLRSSAASNDRHVPSGPNVGLRSLTNSNDSHVIFKTKLGSSWDAGPTLAWDGDVSIANVERLREQNNARDGTGSDMSSPPLQPLSATML